MAVVIDRTRAEGRDKGPASAAEKARRRGDPGGGLYKPRTPIYPKHVRGRWRDLKWGLMVATLAIYYITPWIRWNRPGALPDQAVLVDFEGRRFYMFGLQFWPQEVYFITGLLVMAALALFLASSLFGRLWCGYACPQTIWTDLFLQVERMFEGDRNARMRRDAAPWSLDKVWRKAGKHLVWLGIAFGTGGAWIFYFHDAPTVLGQFWTGEAPATAYIFCALLTFTTYVFAGTLREQVCTYMCPWPRIQGALIDQDSLQVTYRIDRGEPRGPHKKGATWEDRGGCIDCGQCVVVCPMGIDIRDGAQLECINCGLCADACDEMMDRIDRPRGLIGYDTDKAVAARAAGQPAIYRLVRPRTLVYAGSLVLVSGLMLWGLAHRQSFDVHVLRDRNPIAVRLADGSVRNGYTLKIANRSFADADARIAFSGPAGAVLKTPAAPAADEVRARIETNTLRAVRVFVTLPEQAEAETSLPVAFTVTLPEGVMTVKSTFITDPGARP
ncbi:cytochrome c oxidase accessory protein CcoG [Phenylobacterium sp.]|uniref:cytochrome c oxidase accessory protein CcoG n=1 Tax=Phenylobacterium sp. TaxID=1871053 RepID=UPI0025E6EABE|nr:cytochrome c oxidase accessory protein CcoG [Phenylobacterium sp.]MCA3720230.1 cytochrome c oxidase accessory protein CcoG [Phenylobacterium sp.]